MTEYEYRQRRMLLQERFLAIPNPKVLRHTANRVMRMIAALDAEYSGKSTEACYQQLLEEYNIKIKEK